MRHPIFHVGETCYAVVPTGSGPQRIECEITGPLTRRLIRDLDGNHICFAEAYLVLLDQAVRETQFAESDLRKKWQRSDWGTLKTIWQPKRDKLPHAADKGWRLKELSENDPYRFHRQLGQQAADDLMKLYEQEKKKGTR